MARQIKLAHSDRQTQFNIEAYLNNIQRTIIGGNPFVDSFNSQLQRKQMSNFLSNVGYNVELYEDNKKSFAYGLRISSQRTSLGDYNA